MKINRIACLLFVATITVAGIGAGLAHSASVELQNTVQMEWCTVVPSGSMVISEDHKSFTTSSITYTDSNARSGFMTITFKIEVSGDVNSGGPILSISSAQLESEMAGSCILKSSDSVYIGTISGIHVSSRTPFMITGQLSSGLIESLSMDIIVYPAVVS